MSREWFDVVAPKFLHDQCGVYHGIWMPQMDRCWYSDDGYQVTELSFSGERDIPWSIKQAIKNELFGEDRLAIEVFPTEKALVDIMDCYHLWVFPKGFKLPFGIHPTKDTQCRPIARGCLPFTDKLEQNSLRFSRLEK